MQLQIQGPDALRFLQGQLTCDVNTIIETASLGALCNQKGRVLVSFYLAKNIDGYLMQLPDALSELTLKTLRKYAQFSKVTITEITSHENLSSSLTTIRNKIALIDELKISGEFTPHELNYPEIGAVSFNKGCYTGQEIIARMQYLGKLKKHLYYYQCDAEQLSLLDKKNVAIVNIAKNENNFYEMLVVANDQEWERFNHPL